MSEFEQRFPFTCKTSYNHTEVVPWLETNIGQFNREWYRYGTDIAQGIVSGVPLYDYYRFRDEQAVMLFMLKWA